jgi:protein SCO1
MLGRRRNIVLALAIAAAVAVALTAIVSGSSGHGGASGGSSGGTSASVTAGPESRFDGAPLPGTVLARGFTLTDQYGRAVSLSDYRGRVVAVTFLYTTCGATCVLIAQQLRGALEELQEQHARAPVVLIVSADPASDTRARIARFLSQVSLTGRAEYLTGRASQLQKLWAAYRVKPASAGRATFATYASVLLLDGEGRERVLFQSEQLTPEFLSHDIRKLENG